MLGRLDARAAGLAAASDSARQQVQDLQRLAEPIYRKKKKWEECDAKGLAVLADGDCWGLVYSSPINDYERVSREMAELVGRQHALLRQQEQFDNARRDLRERAEQAEDEAYRLGMIRQSYAPVEKAAALAVTDLDEIKKFWNEARQLHGGPRRRGGEATWPFGRTARHRIPGAGLRRSAKTPRSLPPADDAGVRTERRIETEFSHAGPALWTTTFLTKSTPRMVYARRARVGRARRKTSSRRDRQDGRSNLDDRPFRLGLSRGPAKTPTVRRRHWVA